MPTDFIDGPVGRLEYCIEVAPKSDATNAAVLCHPHPLFGGSMHDAALGLINQALLASGVSSLRFNFRGVGQSQGEHDKGRGEVDDVCTAADWLRVDQKPEQLILCGYSFGGAVALSAQARVQADKLILLAPAISLVAGFEPPDVPTLVLLGDSDQFVDVKETQAALDIPNVTIEVIEQADHFFMGASDLVRDKAIAWLSATQ